MLSALLFPCAAHAAQLAYEGFNYATGSGNLTGQTGGTGWNGGWQTVNNGSADVVANSLVAGSSSPTGYDARSIGNCNTLPNNRRVGRFLDTSTDGPFGTRGYRNGAGKIGADGTTLYLSFMQQPNGTTSYYEFEFHRGNLGDSGRIGGIGNDQGAATSVFLRAPNGTHTAIGAGSTAVNFYVVRIDFKAGNDDVYVYRNSTSTTDPGTGAATLTKLAVADMSFDGISFGAFNNGRTVSHDEVRIGQSWDDVTIATPVAPVITLQPRPSTTGYVGGSVTFSSVASGQPDATYQWYKGANPLSGQTNTTLTLSNLQLTDADSYHVVATNSQGSATSNNAVLTVQAAATSGLLVYDGFDYNTGSTNLDGKNGGLGWGAAWASVDGGGANVQTGSLAAGNNGPNGYDAQSFGNSAFMPNGNRSGRLVDTAVGSRLRNAGYIDANGNVGADGKTLYLSFLQQPDGTTSFYEFEFHRGNLGDPGRIGGVGNDTGNPIVNLRTGGAQTLIGPGSTGVNLYVVRIDFKAGNDDVYVYQNPLSATEPATATLIKLNAADMSFNGVSLAAFANGRTVKHDEVRMGQTWSDVMFGASRRQLTWVGDGTANTWNFAAANWNAGSGATTFVDGDPVTFDDTGSDTPAVNVSTNVATASITAGNNTKNYSIGGSGIINCSGALTKSGGGSLALTGTSNFSSAIVVTGGSLTLGGTTTVGSQLNLNAGTTAATLSGTNSFTGTLFANAGTQALSGTNSFSGMVTTNATTTITGPTTITGTGGTTVWIGNLTGANASLTMEAGGSLSITGVFNDAWVMGRDGGNATVVQNGGTITYNSSNHPEAFIGAAAAGGTTASYAMNGGTLEMSNMRLGMAIGPITSTLTQTGGTINVRQLEVGSNLLTGTGDYTMTGGLLNVGAGSITSFSGHYNVQLGGGTISAAADWNSGLAMNFTGTNGDTTFDTAGHKITLSGPLGGTGGLIKSGTGTLVLSGSNNYSGNTAVNAGTLAGSFGGNDSSSVTVASGATVAPGIGGVGLFYCNGATFASGSTLALDVNSSTGMADELVAFADIDISGATLSLQEIGAGTIAIGNSLTILESSVSSVTGTFAGYPDGAVITVGSNSFAIHYQSTNVTLTAISVDPYGTWASAHGLDGSPGKDPAFHVDADNDGIANGLEWVLGGNPLASDATSLVSSTANAVDGLTLVFHRDESSIGNVTLVAQWDTDLDGTWTVVPITQAGGSYANGVTVTVNEATTPDEVTVHIPASNAGGGKLMGRLKATLP